MVALLRKRKPDAVLLIDYPGFNLPFAARAHELGIKVLYYICPQVWAWNRDRIPAMAKNVDRLISIFPFEAEVFKGTGLRVDFAGHPLVSLTEIARSEPLFSLPWSGKPRVAMLPGSRKQEVKLILPVMAKAVDILKIKFPDAGFIIAAASREAVGWIEQILSSMGMAGRFAIVTDKTRQILRQADAAWVASGTATIETALMRCPMVVVYRVRLLTYLAGRMLIRVPFLGMVNIVAGKQICPEFIQQAAKPENLASAIEPLLVDDQARNEMINELDRIRSILGTAGAEERAAEIVLHELV
jgi:lipid-A-disaccharide synthase